MNLDDAPDNPGDWDNMRVDCVALRLPLQEVCTYVAATPERPGFRTTERTRNPVNSAGWLRAAGVTRSTLASFVSPREISYELLRGIRGGVPTSIASRHAAPSRSPIPRLIALATDDALRTLRVRKGWKGSPQVHFALAVVRCLFLPIITLFSLHWIYAGGA